MPNETGESEHASAWLDDIPLGIVQIAAGRVEWINRAAATFLQVDPTRSIGSSLIHVVRDHRVERAYLDGTRIELEIRGRRLVVAPIRGGLSLRDVTALRAQEEASRDLLAVLSHELRTPVTTIQSTLEALASGLPDPQRGRFLARAIQEGQRLVRLLDDLTTESSPPAARTVWVPDVIERAASLLAGVLASRSVEVHHESDPVSVWIDPDKMLQVVLNLLENAAIHGPMHAEVRIETEVSEGGEEVLLRVRDRGGPIDVEDLEDLFARNRRGSDTTVSGRGLGLYIVRSIAERAGGRAWGRRWEHGNEFGVAIPRPPRRHDASSSPGP